MTWCSSSDNTAVQGDAGEVLRGLPPSLFDVVITSPPYFQHRLYTDDPLEVGREKEVKDYVERLAGIFDAVPLKPKGSVWVNIDDTQEDGPMMVPERFCLTMMAHGWRLVNKIIWYKVDAMSESTKRRFSRKYEMFYWFVRNRKDYYFNVQATKIPVKVATVERLEHRFYDNKGTAVSRMRGMVGDKRDLIERYLKAGVNCGDLWITVTNKERVEHIAPYPEALVARPIIACSPDGGRVLDPFCGSGTTLVAALKLGRNCFGIDLNPASVKESNERIAELKATPYLFTEVDNEQSDSTVGDLDLFTDGGPDFGDSHVVEEHPPEKEIPIF